MRTWLLVALLVAVGHAGAFQPPTTVLLFPPPTPPVAPAAQEALIAACQVVWERQHKWGVVTFHRESPSLVRAQREGRLPPDALARPLDHAAALCAEEGARLGLWVRVTKADGSIPQAVEAALLVPTTASFSADLQAQPLTDAERTTLHALRLPPSQWAAGGLALRLGQWLRDRLPSPAPTENAAPADLPDVDALVAAGKWDEAIQALDRLIAANPTDPRLYLRLAALYERQGRWDDAALEYRRATQLQGDLWDAWKGMARVAAKRERWETVLDAVRRLQAGQAADPPSLALGAHAAAMLAKIAAQRGRDREAEMLRQASVALDEALVRSTDDPALLVDAAQRLLAHQRPDLAATALEKLSPSTDVVALDQGVPLAVAAKRPDLAYRLLRQRLRVKAPYAPSEEPFRACLLALNAETVRLFEAVRDALTAFDRTALSPPDLQGRLRAINADAEQLLKVAYNLRPPEPFAALYKRRLLAYELFLQATALLREWAETRDGLTRTRAVVLYDFARAELESVWADERRAAR